ncbi:MAG: glycerophosphodiester phosphodiesterase [Pseudomonadota bacterium]|nr:glycerophosphodiester phosphodiesterase [Pseudomonadota bacterium]
MRSSRSAPDPLHPGPHGFAHRGVHRAPTIPENSLTAFAAALEINAGIECDVRLTADDEVLVFHDRDARRLCNDPAVIGDSSLAQLAHLRVGTMPIPTLRGMLALVTGRVPILIEAKVECDLRRFGPALLKALDGYAGYFGVMSFDPRLARWLKTRRPEIRRGLVIRDNLSPPERGIAMLLADPDFLAVDVAALGKAWVTRARRRIPVYSWTIKSRQQRSFAARFADASIWEADGRP